MTGANIFACLLLLAATLFQVNVTRRVHRSALFDGQQKRAQTKLVWLLPIFGAAIVLGVIASEEEAARPKNENRL